jgi:hypothetical protein
MVQMAWQAQTAFLAYANAFTCVAWQLLNGRISALIAYLHLNI